MKILAPVSSVYEAELLADCGAAELYCGIHPDTWGSQEVWLNRRGPGQGNINSLKTLEELTGTAHKHKARVFLTLNLPFYPSQQYAQIETLLKQVEQCGIDAFIIADPGMIIAAKKACPNIDIHVSSLSAVLNSGSVEFFRQLGVRRIVFPRYLGLAELKQVIDKTGSSLEYEVFVLNDGCVFEEGYCHVSHAFGGAFCHNPWWTYKPVSLGANQQAGNIEGFAAHLEDYRWWLWLAIRNNGGMPGPGGLPMGMCGLCALPELNRLGINSLKIVGREASLEKKVASVKMVKQVLDELYSGGNRFRVKEKAREIRQSKEVCDSGYMCYYR